MKDKIIKVLATMFLNKRARSFYWRSGMMFIAGISAIASEAITGSNIDPTTTVLIGLALGEFSKAVYNYIKENEKDL